MTAPCQRVEAAGYTVTEAKAVLYTNSNTIIFADADENTVVLSQVASDLPIQVTGITSNGYFQISLGGQTFYIQGAGLSQQASLDSVYTYVYNTMIAQKAVFPEGLHWTNDNYYEWHGGVFKGGYGCAGFAFYLSDAAFGNAKAKVHKDYSNIRVGDILRVYNDTHSVIVLEVRQNSVIVAEGNYNSSIHWGREMTMSEIVDESSYIMTRY